MRALHSPRMLGRAVAADPHLYAGIASFFGLRSAASPCGGSERVYASKAFAWATYDAFQSYATASRSCSASACSSIISIA